MASAPVFVVGAPRSGTTLTQNLLGSHPAVVTSQETDLFDGYVAAWRERWERQLPADPELWGRQRHKGLPAVIAEAEFDDVLAAVVERVFAATRALKPEATVLVDKTPRNALHGELILRYLPDARFVHVIRDGRDVVCSMLRAKRGWGREWAEPTLELATRNWRRHVEAGRAIGALTDAYVEVRYEELCSDARASELSRLLAFCGVEASDEECARICAADAPGIVWGGEVIRRLGHAPEEPPGFAGEGGVGTWRSELGPYERFVFERRAGALLRELDYDTAGWAQLGPTARAGAAVRLALVHRRDRLHSRLSGAAGA